MCNHANTLDHSRVGQATKSSNIKRTSRLCKSSSRCCYHASFGLVHNWQLDTGSAAFTEEEKGFSCHNSRRISQRGRLDRIKRSGPEKPLTLPIHLSFQAEFDRQTKRDNFQCSVSSGCGCAYGG